MGWLDWSGCSEGADAGQTSQPLPNDDSTEWDRCKAHYTEKQEGNGALQSVSLIKAVVRCVSLYQ